MRMPLLIALLALAAACGRTAEEQDAALPVSQTGSDTIAPPISPPTEGANAAVPPSYEVAIASAAAIRNRAKDRCATQPEAVRVQCEQEANAAFAEARERLGDLRGNPQ